MCLPFDSSSSSVVELSVDSLTWLLSDFPLLAMERADKKPVESKIKRQRDKIGPHTSKKKKKKCKME